MHGGFGYGVRNNDGVRILEFADSLSLVLCNTYFKKDPKYYITFASGGNVSLIDFILVRDSMRKAVANIKVFPGEKCVSQHRLDRCQ